MTDIATFDKINLIRKNSKLANIFLLGKKMNEFVDDESVKICFGDDIVIFKKRTDICTKVYYFAKDLPALKTIGQYLDESDKRPIMLDIIGKDGEPEKICEELSQCGFSHYITFGKWTGNSNTLKFRREYTDEPIWDEPVRRATIDDLDSVYNLLYDNFDRLAYELQNREELEEQIEKGEVYVTGIEGRVVAFFIALRPSESVCMLDYSAVDPSVRGVGACMYIYGYVLQRLPANVKIVYYANPLNSVTGREDGLFGMTKENFSKIIMQFDN